MYHSRTCTGRKEGDRNPVKVRKRLLGIMRFPAEFSTDVLLDSYKTNEVSNSKLNKLNLSSKMKKN
jgi:hypothetical protein